MQLLNNYPLSFLCCKILFPSSCLRILNVNMNILKVFVSKGKSSISIKILIQYSSDTVYPFVALLSVNTKNSIQFK